MTRSEERAAALRAAGADGRRRRRLRCRCAASGRWPRAARGRRQRADRHPPRAQPAQVRASRWRASSGSAPRATRTSSKLPSAAGARRLVAQSIAFVYAPAAATPRRSPRRGRAALARRPGALRDDPPRDGRRRAGRRSTPASRRSCSATAGSTGPGRRTRPTARRRELIRKRRYPVVGNGAGVSSFIHVDDAADATVAAVASAATGVLNVVDDEPAAAATSGCRPPPRTIGAPQAAGGRRRSSRALAAGSFAVAFSDAAARRRRTRGPRRRSAGPRPTRRGAAHWGRERALRPLPHRHRSTSATSAPRCWPGCSPARPARASSCASRTSTRGRVRPGLAEEQLADLAAIGLDWDPPVDDRSPSASDAYADAIARLDADGAALPVLLHAPRDPRGGLGAARPAARGRLPRHVPRADGGASAPSASARGRPPALRLRAGGERVGFTTGCSGPSRASSTTSSCAATTARPPTTSPSSSTTPRRASRRSSAAPTSPRTTPRQILLARRARPARARLRARPARPRPRRRAAGQAPRRGHARRPRSRAARRPAQVRGELARECGTGRAGTRIRPWTTCSRASTRPRCPASRPSSTLA